ncbi:hypothetical protein PPTG_19669 [Phytophthora nicotianae INRA-310]|uniref:Cas12f1-like TNB domain-containing protein n=1 Tax=Phytophthora nicotianae (strain INRA-310) TaxID=761204 RepID=W2PB96_PHYN3|nr:hypothetical protein PPTG_19669 [Phytophthora nicotianae INRA-310]ETM98307.1 hypothetical protein PPTG_19669 [Phytophthora nicotianae INRA-310]
MGPPPNGVYDTPKNLRFNTLRTFQTNVKSALSNVKNGNIKKFKIDFSSKKKSPSFTISQDGEQAKIREEKSVFYLSITNLKDIRVKMNAHVEISSEIDILNINGFWYVAIPEYVEPTGNVLEFGRGTKAYLDAIRKRRDNAQSVMSKFKNKKKSKRWQYRAYVRAKRTFLSSTAKLKNCVKELHLQTCSYLVKHYDVILLPIFQSKDMFLQLLQAKCEVVGKTVVVCSEMYTSRTCTRCERLHLKLGSNDVFTCPHCSYTAGRDEHAAFNILRYVCAGSLQTYA